MRDITFRDNRVSSGIYGGGGMHVVGGHTTLTDALFTGNSALSGGGIGLTSFVPGGDAQGGGGTSYPDTTLALTNVVLAANTALQGGGGAGMNAAGGSATLTNVDFVANSGTGGAGLRLGSSDSLGPNNATVSVTNSILWGNTVSGSPQQFVVTGGSLTVTDSDVQGGWTGTGNIDGFPFVNSGDPSLLQDIDWDGLDNVFGTVDDGIRLDDRFARRGRRRQRGPARGADHRPPRRPSRPGRRRGRHGHRRHGRARSAAPRHRRRDLRRTARRPARTTAPPGRTPSPTSRPGWPWPRPATARRSGSPPAPTSRPSAATASPPSCSRAG